MPMTHNELQSDIQMAFPDADIEINALNDDDNHWSLTIKSGQFKGLTRVQQHQLVYNALGGKMGGVLHALALTTIAK